MFSIQKYKSKSELLYTSGNGHINSLLIKNTIRKASVVYQTFAKPRVVGLIYKKKYLIPETLTRKNESFTFTRRKSKSEDDIMRVMLKNDKRVKTFHEREATYSVNSMLALSYKNLSVQKELVEKRLLPST